MTQLLTSRVRWALRRSWGGARLRRGPAAAAPGLPHPEEGADGQAAWEVVSRHLPDTIAPIPGRHLVARPLAAGLDLPGVVVRGPFAPGSWLFLDRRQLGKVALRVTAREGGEAASRLVLVQAGTEATGARGQTMEVRLTPGDAFVACGHVRRFPSVITVGHGARVEIGDRTSTAGIEIKVTAGTVSIGRDCQIGSGTKVMALHYHGVVDLDGPEPRLVPRAQEVRVGNHVWLGEESRLLGGARIGDGAILGAFSVLAGEVPANCVAVGNPARVVRRNRTWSRWDASIDPDSMSYIASLPRRGRDEAPG